MKFKRTKSNCQECPLRGQKQVLGTTGIENPSVMIIGGCPDEKDEEAGEPFSGMVGKKLKDAVAQSGLIHHMVHRTNLLLCRPTDNRLDSLEGIEAVKCCTPGLLQEIAEIGAKAIMPMEAEVLTVMGLSGKLGKIRGSVYAFGKKQFAIPTYSPQFILRGMWKEEGTWSADFMKAREISVGKWKPAKEKFNLFPTIGEVGDFVTRAIEGKKLIGVDIETTSLNGYYGKVLMIGLAMSGEEVLVVPFTKQGGAAYWSLGDEVAVHRMVNELLKKCPTMYQNASFDVKFLECHGYQVGNIAEDTMLAHHDIHPELPHNLGYIVSVYGKTPAWKEVVKGQATRMINMDDTEVRSYNARDAAVLHQIMPELIKDLKELETYNTYRRWSMRLLRPLIDMSKNGMLIDKKALVKLKAKFGKEAEGAKRALLNGYHLPDSFNFDSNYHMQYLVTGGRPKKFQEWREELQSYDEAGQRKRKDTKKYAELVGRLEIYQGVTPLLIPKVRLKANSTGTSMDDDTFVTIQKACINRLDAMEDLVKQTDAVEIERVGLQRTLKFIETYREYSVAQKYFTTFTGYPLGPDGRVHPNYRIDGTATGRLSCNAPNLQNQPEGVQGIFVAGPGRMIIKADYSNIEYRVMAVMTGEEELLRKFEAGENFHDINTNLLFGLTKKDPEWDKYRRAAKVFIFGLSYGGGIAGIYQKILVQVPEMKLTMAQFKVIVDKYFSSLKNYSAWRDKITKQARETRCVATAFGRKRFLLGMPDEIERQALNAPIQGTAGEIAEEAICDCYDEFQKPKNKKWNAKLVCTVHDSILTECDEDYAVDVAKAMKKIMEKEWTITGRSVCFPVDVEIGKSWGTTEKVKL